MKTGSSSVIEGTSLRIVPNEFPDPAVDVPLAAGGAPPGAAVLAGGCFWCTEAVYRELDGVLAVTPGYAGGTRETADYKTVSTGRTRHAETIRISYDPARLTYGQLLKLTESVADQPAQVIADVLYNTVELFAAGRPRHDDQTIIVLKGSEL